MDLEQNSHPPYTWSNWLSDARQTFENLSTQDNRFKPLKKSVDPLLDSLGQEQTEDEEGNKSRIEGELDGISQAVKLSVSKEDDAMKDIQDLFEKMLRVHDLADRVNISYLELEILGPLGIKFED